MNEEKKHVKFKKTELWQIISGVLAVLLVFSIFYPLYSKKDGTASQAYTALSQEDVKNRLSAFINENLVAPGTKAEVTSKGEENGIYKFEISVQGQKIISYSTKNGEVFFPQAMNVEEIKKQMQEKNSLEQKAQAEEPEGIPKTGRPKVELFVMSHCPYGTQMEKAMLPVMELLEDKADIQIKFCDYAMHGKAELDEQLNQACISRLFADKYTQYLKCFLKEGKSAECVKESKIDEAQLNGCIKGMDAEFNVSKNYEDRDLWLNGRYPKFVVYQQENDKYGVQGSPTLVVNGVELSPARNPASLLNAICNAFTTKPEECSQKLSASQPSPGFGFAESGSSASAECGA